MKFYAVVLSTFLRHLYHNANDASLPEAGIWPTRGAVNANNLLYYFTADAPVFKILSRPK